MSLYELFKIFQDDKLVQMAADVSLCPIPSGWFVRLTVKFLYAVRPYIKLSNKRCYYIYIHTCMCQKQQQQQNK